jgi:small subunit ribosomal protein S7
MPRRHSATKREIEPDPVHQSLLLAKFINRLMLSGKKSTARTIVYSALEKFTKKVNAPHSLAAFEQAIENAKPSVEVKTRRVGGSNYQVPVEIPYERRLSLAMKWIIKHSRAKPGRQMEDALSGELSDCYNNQGTTIKKKDDTHRMAEANKAFAHYKW